MEMNCDNCGKEIGVDIKSRLKAVENNYNIYYDLKNEIKNIIRNNEASKIKSKFKKFFFRKFKTINVQMPIPCPGLYDSVDFCDTNCHNEWKNKIKDAILGDKE